MEDLIAYVKHPLTNFILTVNELTNFIDRVHKLKNFILSNKAAAPKDWLIHLSPPYAKVQDEAKILFSRKWDKRDGIRNDMAS